MGTRRTTTDEEGEGHDDYKQCLFQAAHPPVPCTFIVLCCALPHSLFIHATRHTPALTFRQQDALILNAPDPFPPCFLVCQLRSLFLLLPIALSLPVFAPASSQALACLPSCVAAAPYVPEAFRIALSIIDQTYNNRSI